MFLEPVDENLGRRPKIGGAQGPGLSFLSVGRGHGGPGVGQVRSARSGPPAGARASFETLVFASKTANLRLDEPPLTVRMHDRSGRLIAARVVSVSCRGSRIRQSGLRRRCRSDETLYGGQYS